MAVNGVQSLMRKFNELGSMDPIAAKAMKKQAERVRGVAVKLCPANHGELKGSIHTKVEQEAGAIIGCVYTNADYAIYVEFGTGPAGEESHAGVSPNVPVVYRQNPWWFPGDKVDPSDAEKYHWPESSNGEQTFYYTDGQPAQPFMYPALKTMEKHVVAGLAADLQAGIKKVGGST